MKSKNLQIVIVKYNTYNFADIIRVPGDRDESEKVILTSSCRPLKYYWRLIAYPSSHKNIQ